MLGGENREVVVDGIDERLRGTDCSLALHFLSLGLDNHRRLLALIDRALDLIGGIASIGETCVGIGAETLPALHAGDVTIDDEEGLEAAFRDAHTEAFELGIPEFFAAFFGAHFAQEEVGQLKARHGHLLHSLGTHGTQTH